ncbi:b2e0e720-fc8d-4f89-b3be-3d9cfdcdfa29 [Sclerotinia trifoliorum]|uniref:B2e0e720-fc8d-4f89-b3be-3d9cfdcdfa29 n=1 Tax=Sclerotinia trifoliorum TaxID=28548 RepID=A0A8H2VZE2_9HELO|nr:b2e0e720-fc8d-4f89-b3be-3d9cfdcdfa29 [Sclerotinia trifoliorum]
MLSKGSAYMAKLPGGIHEGIRTLVDKHTSNATSLLITEVMKDSQTQKKATGQSKAHPVEEKDKRGVKRGKQAKKVDQSPTPSKKARSGRAESSTKVIEETSATKVEKSRPSVGKSATTSTKTKDGVAKSDGKEAIEPSLTQLWQAEVEKLGVREAETQMTIRNLKAELKHLDEARKTRQDEGRKTQEEDANVSRETRQFEDLEEIYRLTKENREMHKFATFADLNSSGSLHLGHDIVDDAMDQIQFELSSISYRRSTTGRLVPIIFAISGDLRSLTLSAFSSDIETATGRDDVETILKKFGAQTCIRVLVLAAVRDWVFMSRFPNFTPSNPRILSSYRHMISTLDGRDKLYSLDMAAHRTMIEEKWFNEKLIPRRAMDLADRFSNAVAPLFTATSESVGDGLFHTWGEHRECWKDRRAHLQEIFQTALILKADSVVTKYLYEFALYPVGTTFVGDTSDLKESGKPKNGDNWIHASFHVYDSMNFGNAKETALVQTENFVKASGKMAEAKYSKVLLLPKRQSEAASSRIIETAENSSPKHKTAGQSNVEPEAGTQQINDATNSTVGGVKEMKPQEAKMVQNLVQVEVRLFQRAGNVVKNSQLLLYYAGMKKIEVVQSAAEHSGYRASRFGEIIEQAYTQPQISAIVDQEKGRYHEEILAAVARNFSPTHQRTGHNPGNQLVEAQRTSSAIAPQVRPTKVLRDELEQKILESETVDVEAKCELCGKLFSNRDNLQCHNKKTDTCSFECPDCKTTFADPEERRRHQRTEHRFVERELKDPRTISEPQTPPTSPRKTDKSRRSNHTRTPSSNDARVLDKSKSSPIPAPLPYSSTLLSHCLCGD